MKRHAVRILLLLFAFSLNSLLAQNRPVLTFPTNGADYVSPTNNTFSWYYINTNIYSTYTLEVYYTPDCSGAPLITRTVNGPAANINNLTGLLSGLTYYWRVRAVNASTGTSPWSDVWKFTTTGIAPLHISATSSKHGKISPAGTILVSSGTSKTFTITPDNGCFIQDVLVDNASVGAVTGYTFTNITSSHTISAVFGTPTFRITASSSAGGTVSPSGTTTADFHTNVRYTFTPDPGFRVTGITIDGQPVAPASEYTFTNIDANHTIYVTFSNKFIISVKSTGSGTIYSPEQHAFLTPDFPFLVDPNGNITLTFSGLNNYHLASLKIDGALIPSAKTTRFGATIAYNHTLTNVQANHLIEAAFTDTYPVTVTAGPNGRADTSGTFEVKDGTRLFIKAIPDDGYRIGEVYNNSFQIAPFSPLDVFISEPADIYIKFVKARTWNVSTSGNNLNTGEPNSPLRTIEYAILQSSWGDSIVIANGIYDEFITLYRNNIRVRGSGSTFVNGIRIPYGEISISNIRINPSATFNTTTQTAGVVINGRARAALDKITSSGLSVQGIWIENSPGVTITNSDFSNNTQGGMFISGSSNINLTDVTINNNQSGGIITQKFNPPGAPNESYSNSNFNFTRVTANFNCRRADGTYDISSPGGILLQYVSSSAFKDITANNNSYGIRITASQDLNFSGGSFNSNANTGILITPMNAVSGADEGSISNIAFSGNINVINNILPGIYINTLPVAGNSTVSGVSFTGKTVVERNVNNSPLIEIAGSVNSAVFRGLDLKGTGGGVPAISVYDFGVRKASGIKINNSIFRTLNGIFLKNALADIFASEDVDARNNVFTALPAAGDIPFLLVDKTDLPAQAIGTIDYTGSTAGTQPAIIVKSIIGAYSGATYFIDINLEQKGTEYLYIKGSFFYDITKLDFLGFLSNGLMNNAHWSLNVNETTPGLISFNGFGTTPINSDGRLFSLQMKIIESAAGATLIGGIQADFTGNATPGEFAVTGGALIYTIPNGAVQAKGDVTLDGIVNIQDFYSLLLHLAGSTLLTSPAALSNADFNNDGGINQTDLNLLYTFITGNVPPPNPSLTGGTVAFRNTAFNNDGSVIVPVSFKNASDLKCAELTLTYDPSLIEYQAFTSAVDEKYSIAHAFEVTPGVVKFSMHSSKLLQGDINPGEIVLHFKGNKIPVGSVILTSVSLNGESPQPGPNLVFVKDGLTGLSRNEKEIPVSFGLSQNFPNPFNPSTTITCSVAEESFVTVRIYNMLGQEIKTLISEEKSAGVYFVKWNGDNSSGEKVSSGTYICRMTAGNKSSARKMVLMK